VTHNHTVERSTQHTSIKAASKLLTDNEGGTIQPAGAQRSYILPSSTHEKIEVTKSAWKDAPCSHDENVDAVCELEWGEGIQLTLTWSFDYSNLDFALLPISNIILSAGPIDILTIQHTRN
jgi:hypothetical protein